MYAGFVQGDSWAQALLAQMPSDVAGQMVPVLSAGTLLDSQGSRCWCVIELIGE
jgi:hypothetical protein